MGHIQVLPFDVANLIAAGEVVDRPASAVKEMMENAIDAGAAHITVEIQNGGVSLMRVSDDGCGMSAEDLPMAIRRHATSKIRVAEDLDGIATLGFRGEALAAISSVSDMRIISKRHEDATGALLEVTGGTFVGVREYGGRDGTTVIVENLFANVPARRKFLKRDATEAMAVAANVECVALSHPEIAVRFISDGVMKLETAGDGELKSAIWAVFGKDFAMRLIPLDEEYEGVRVHGFVGRSDNVKSNRNGQNFFINNRFVRSRTVQAALEQAYVSYIPPDKYPSCVLNIDLNPARVDVNVHPAKLEVKFSNEKPVFEAVYYATRSALEQNTVRPTFVMPEKPLIPGGGKVSEATRPVEIERPESLARRQVTMDATPKPAQTHITAAQYRRDYLHDETPRQASVPVASVPENSHEPTAREKYEAEKAYLFGDAPKPVTAPTPAPTVEEPIHIPDLADASLKPYRVVGEVFHAYVIVEMGDRMLLVDKHAAHERIIFEHLKAQMQKRTVESQMLMIPIDVMLMSEEVGLLEEYRPELEAVGFTYVCLRNTARVDSIPSGVDPVAVPDMIAAIAANLRDGIDSAHLARDTFFEKALYQASCKAAIKAGRDYPAEQIDVLIDKLMALPDITVCPHGRPVAMELSKHKIDHQFERC